MKKQPKEKSSFAPPEVQSDIADLIVKMQQQLNVLEKKIDTLVGRSPEKPPERQYSPKPFQRFDQSYRRGESRQDNSYRERVLHKAICADCNKECEVPFRPSQDRPVYCKDCFSKRKGGGSFKGRTDDRRRETGSHQASHFDKPQGGEKKKFFGKKRPDAKRRKMRN